MLLLPQNTGYCQPIFQQLEGLFGERRALLNSKPGTLQALLSNANTPRSAGGTAAVDVELYKRGNGKRNEYRLYFEKRSACPTDLGACTSYDAVDFCADATENANNFIEYVLGPDDICGQKVGDFVYNYSEAKNVCPMDLAATIAKEFREKMDNYAIALNKYLYAQIARAYTVDTPIVDACVSSSQFGSGMGGWVDMLGNYNAAATPISFEVMQTTGAIFPFFVTNWNKLMMANGFGDSPIVVHGHGALYDYLTFLNNGVYAGANDQGLDVGALAGRIGMFPYLEGRPRANNNPGVTHDTVLAWEPGSHILIQPYMLGEPLQAINDPTHERYQFVDSTTGLQFLVSRKREYCQSEVKDHYQIHHFFKLISKPLDMTECLYDPNGTLPVGAGLNQTVLIDFNRCTPTDCAGNPSWGPVGDPTTDLDPTP